MVSSKALIFGVVVLVGCFLTASSLTCYKCDGENTAPQCNATEVCGTGYTQCLSEVEKDDDDKITYKRGCAFPATCTTNEGVCSVQKLANNIKECKYTCCKEDRCNSEFPTLGSGVQVASVLVIAATLFFSLFVM